ncbi:preprotein translocase subunit SecG [Candidatus Parcubacteria bacterium]|nr:preprotein translocase subunit SecG [Candidatus Parcubacteria bacterium]
MGFLTTALPYAEIVLSAALVGTILLQQTSAQAGGAFGGDGGSSYHTRRGAEKALFNLTIVIGVLFAFTALAALLLK